MDGSPASVGHAVRPATATMAGARNGSTRSPVPLLPVLAGRSNCVPAHRSPLPRHEACQPVARPGAASYLLTAVQIGAIPGEPSRPRRSAMTKSRKDDDRSPRWLQPSTPRDRPPPAHGRLPSPAVWPHCSRGHPRSRGHRDRTHAPSSQPLVKRFLTIVKRRPGCSPARTQGNAARERVTTFRRSVDIPSSVAFLQPALSHGRRHESSWRTEA